MHSHYLYLKWPQQEFVREELSKTETKAHFFSFFLGKEEDSRHNCPIPMLILSRLNLSFHIGLEQFQQQEFKVYTLTSVQVYHINSSYNTGSQPNHFFKKKMELKLFLPYTE